MIHQFQDEAGYHDPEDDHGSLFQYDYNLRWHKVKTFFLTSDTLKSRVVVYNQ
jgi:hypothetical protein